MELSKEKNDEYKSGSSGLYKLWGGERQGDTHTGTVIKIKRFGNRGGGGG